MDERTDDVTVTESATSRRAIAKGVAAGGLAALFAAVGSGRALGQSGEDADTTPDEVDDADTTPNEDPADTTPDEDAADTTPNETGVPGGSASSSKQRSRGRGRGRGKGRGKKGRR
jgi:hypothetical protein